MYKLRLLIRLFFQGASERSAADAAGVSRGTVRRYWSRIRVFDYDYDDWLSMDDQQVSRLLVGPTKQVNNDPRYDVLYAQLPTLAKELRKRGMTMSRLHRMYQQKHPDGYQLTAFCKHLGLYLKRHSGTMIHRHTYGDQMMVDYAGQKLEYRDQQTNRLVECEVFVAILPASQYVYAEAHANQRQEFFIDGCQNALRFFGGVPRAIVPDNLKSAVIKAHRYEPRLNPAFAAFLEHYGVAGLPARSGKPKDKALVELTVKHIYTHIYLDVRALKPKSLDELNMYIWEFLDKFNERERSREQTRTEEYLEHELPTLGALPERGYEPFSYKKAKVRTNGHITLSVDSHHYSVPYQLKGKTLEINYTASEVKIYDGFELVATHDRNYRKGLYTTDPDHLSPNHQYVALRSKQMYLDRGKLVGPCCLKVVERCFRIAQHPEQAFRTCDGILSLGKRYSDQELELSCKMALSLDHINYYVVSEIVEKRLWDRQENPATPLHHKHVRGGDYYADVHHLKSDNHDRE